MGEPKFTTNVRRIDFAKAAAKPRPRAEEAGVHAFSAIHVHDDVPEVAGQAQVGAIGEQATISLPALQLNTFPLRRARALTNDDHHLQTP